MSIQRSFLSQLNFKFVINRLPNVMLNINRVVLPSLTVQDVDIQTPFNYVMHYPDKVQWGDLTIGFKVDENMTDYLELYRWIIDIGRPEEFSSSSSNRIRNADYQNEFSDATLSIMNSAQRPIVEIRFKEIFPYVLSELDFTTIDPDVQYLDASVQFRVLSFTLHDL